MRRIFILVALVFGLQVIQTAAQDTTPGITSFTTTSAYIAGDHAGDRRALVPVSWITKNRPLTANLYFDQVMPDGSLVNVELPRVNPWVASSGSGLAAPIYPSFGASTITLRLTLRNYLTGQIYDTRELTLTVQSSNTGQPNSGDRPAIRRFDAPGVAAVDPDELAAGTVRIPVQWEAVNRPLTANLVFEQVLDTGSVVNVELPRNAQWVNSADRGIVAPQMPQAGAGEIVLRIRLVDLIFNRTYDQRDIRILIVREPDPVISLFSTTISTIERNSVISGRTQIGVIWSVYSRPVNTNLVFEQVMPDGSLRNAELPRDVQIVPSSGSGVVVPVLPAGDVSELIFQMRLVRLSDGQTLVSETSSVQLLTADNVNANLAIDSFSASPDPARAGQDVTFSWSISGGERSVTAEIYVVQDGITAPAASIYLTSASGTSSYRLQNDNQHERQFALIVTDEVGHHLREDITIAVQCAYAWILPVDTTNCASGVGISGTAAYQRFEHGVMIWSPGESSVPIIYVLYDDGSAQFFTDNWSGQAYTIVDTPPDGLLAPERGFGYLWNGMPAVRAGLGWAQRPEQGYTITQQSSLMVDSTLSTYMTTPDGRTITIVAPSGGTRTWHEVS